MPTTFFTYIHVRTDLNTENINRVFLKYTKLATLPTKS